MTLRRMLPFVLINILVSATVVVVVLSLWERRNPPAATADPAAAGTGINYEVGATPDPALTQASPAAAASDNLTPAATPEPTDACFVPYVITTGDTLGSISLQFDVPLSDITTHNNILDPNIVAVGQQLIIPLCGLATPTAPPEPTATPAPTPLPTAAFQPGETTLQITGVAGVGDLANEQLTLANNGAAAVILTGWTLQDATGTTYTFGQITLFGDGAALTLHTAAGPDSATDLYWGLTAPVWEAGETATLRDSAGNVQATFTLP